MSKISRKKSRKATIFDPALMRPALLKSLLMLNPLKMARNPVMFVTEIGAMLTTLVWCTQIRDLYTGGVTVILWLTVLFANFAEARVNRRVVHVRGLAVEHVTRAELGEECRILRIVR